jgi:molybdopterin biosynthesis enzyme
MSAQLSPLSLVLEHALSTREAVAARPVSVGEALGLALAEAVCAPFDAPKDHVALRDGLAVAALDAVGASRQSPAFLPGAPKAVAAGDPLPAGCDAVIDLAALEDGGLHGQLIEAVEPGAHVRFAGDDLRAGQLIAAAGAVVTPEIALVASLAGVTTVSVRAARLAVELPDGPLRLWIVAKGLAAGCIIVDDDADLVIRAATSGAPRLALAGAETAWLSRIDGALVLELPQRFDGAVLAWCALALPCVAALLGVGRASCRARLVRKVVSPIGLSDVVLVRLRDGVAEPLSSAAPTLAAIAAADAFMVASAETEGYPAQDDVEVVSLGRPFSTLG